MEKSNNLKFVKENMILSKSEDMFQVILDLVFM